MLIVGSDKPWYEIVLLIITALLGIYVISAGMEGYMNHHMPWWQRIAALAGGLLMVIPGYKTDLAGLVLIAVVLALQFIGKKKDGGQPEKISEAA